ncbi:MAG: hypothetical protein AAFV29_20130, partial [Myxococcota bacterium]
MWLFSSMTQQDAARTLVLCGGLAMTWSTIVGFLMLVPMQPWAQGIIPNFNIKHMGAAHLDWIVLALMLGLAAGVIVYFDLQPTTAAIIALCTGAWLNP